MIVFGDGPILRFATSDLLAQAGAGYSGTLLGREVRLDHVVRVEPSLDALHRSLDLLVAAGGEVVEAAHRFPEDVCATSNSDEAWTKWMASIAVDDQDGFEGFELLKPTDSRTTWLVVTRWRDEDSFNAWVNSPAFGHGHRSEAERSAKSMSSSIQMKAAGPPSGRAARTSTLT